ncbi:MAG TPA: hypothetical protein VNZ61_14235 [Roseomonas sp.]|nr:hypothetical protein [Roseomonas sp.]
MRSMTLEHASGLPTVSGAADWPPTTNQLAYGDPIGGLNAAALARGSRST